MVESIDAHPDFTTENTWTINILQTGTDDIIPETGVTAGTISLKAVSLVVYTNQSLTYVPISQTTYDTIYKI